jgi:hypothetical protein
MLFCQVSGMFGVLVSVSHSVRILLFLFWVVRLGFSKHLFSLFVFDFYETGVGC